MKIQKFDDKELDDLIDFNKNIYPWKKNVAKSIYYRFYDNPFSKSMPNEILVAKDKENNIIGQDLLMPCKMTYGWNTYPAYWAMDFYVDEKSRGITGLLLAKKATIVENLFGVGYTKQSLGLRLGIGENVIGYLTKYIRIVNPFSFSRYFISRKKKLLKNIFFPNSIKSRGGVFKKVTNPNDIVSPEGYWNKDFIEFIRNKDFIEWRFYSNNDYTVYKYFPVVPLADYKPIYFVIKPIIWKKTNCLTLVDYRIVVGDHDVCAEVFRAALKLTRKLKMGALITGCSVPSFNQILRRNLFFKYGKRLEIISRFYKNIESDIPSKSNVYVTLADSDCDFYVNLVRTV